MTTEAEDAVKGIGDCTPEAAEWLNESEAALLLGMSPSFIHRQVATGALKAHRQERVWLVGRAVVEFESMARRAFNRVDDAMTALDHLRDQPVHDFTQAVIRVGQEYELNERVVMDMAARAPAFIPDGQTATMFDVIDLVTNEANNPAIRNRMNVRHQLERAGGHVAIDPASRCDKCESRLT